MMYHRKMELRSSILLAVLVGGCADETIVLEPAEFGELCGEVGPVRILALDPDRPLASVGSWGTIDERRILRVGYLGEEPLPEAFPPIGEQELWSVGLCGEEPLLLAAGDIRLVQGRKAHYLDAWPEVLLVCDEATGQISALDPSGARPPNPVFETIDCSGRAIDDGVLTLVPHDEESAALVLQRWPEDPWTMKAEPVVVHDSVRLPTWLNLHNHGPGTADEDFLLVTTADELVAVSRLDGELTTVATDVHGFSFDSSGRYIVWQSTELTNGDPDSPEGPISFLDRQTNEVTQLTQGSLLQTGGADFVDELDTFSLWIPKEQVHRFYRLPSLESFDVPVRIIDIRVIDDTRVLALHGSFPAMEHSLIDTVTGEVVPLPHGTGRTVGGDADAALVLENVSCCLEADDNRKAGELWRVPWDGEAELLARHATNTSLFTTDHRVVTPLAVGADWTGSLIVVDPTTLDEQVIDEDVLAFLPMQDDLEVDGDPVILYGVAHPERHGVWLARLAP
jgi:hypothetical protein